MPRVFLLNKVVHSIQQRNSLSNFVLKEKNCKSSETTKIVEDLEIKYY